MTELVSMHDSTQREENMARILSAEQMKNIAKKRPKTLVVEVAEKIREMIFKREFALGEMLSEEQIAASMKISRTPVREAFSLLQLQGLITILPQRGSFVFTMGADDLGELIQYRLILEQQALTLAINVDRPNATARLNEVLEQLTQAKRQEDPLTYAEADTLFHEVFFEYCGNHYLRQAYEIVSGKIAALRTHLAEPLQIQNNPSYEEHMQMTKAFSRGELTQALEILRRHILVMEDNYKQALATLEERRQQG